MKKILVLLSTISLLGLGVSMAFAATGGVTAINVGSQTGSLTSGTAGTSTYVLSFTETGSNPSISGLSVSGLPSGATYALSATSSSANGSAPLPNVSLTISTTAAVSSGDSIFTVSSTNPALSATGTLSIAAAPAPVAACNGSTFDTFTPGTVNGQSGWYVSGPFDQEIVPNTFGVAGFGCKSLRISDATTSVFIYNQVFSGPSNAEAGEASALNSNGATGTTNNRFEAQFDLASVTGNEQPGMHMSVSPDRGDGTRMSSLGFVDTATGIDVYFDDVTGTTSPVTFNDTKIATLDRLTSHTIKYLMDFVEGPSNDVVKVYIDGNLVHTGTSWENFYRYDASAYNGPTPTSSRTVGHLVFYESDPGHPSNLYGGYLIDNVSLLSTTTPVSPVSTSTVPVITLNGASTMNLFVGDTFTDPGATAVSGTTTIPVTATGTVDTSVIGSYSILYTANDNGNIATTTRTVNVAASSSSQSSTSTVPVITLNGSSTMILFAGTPFTDPGATALSGTTTVPVTASGAVDTAIAGNYTILYTATSSSNEVATTTRAVNVVSTSTPPIITLNGSSTMNLTAGSAFTDPGATAVDAIGGSVAVTATGTVNTSAVGTYTLTYSATDRNNNVATTSRSVNVTAAPTPAPVFGGGGGGPVGGAGYFIFSPEGGETTPSSATPPAVSGSVPPITVVGFPTASGQVLGVSVYNFTRNLKFGSSGDDVIELQRYLASQGYLTIAVPTRYFGKLTRGALIKWQRAHNLPATGYFGPMSRAVVIK